MGYGFINNLRWSGDFFWDVNNCFLSGDFFWNVNNFFTSGDFLYDVLNFDRSGDFDTAIYIFWYFNNAVHIAYFYTWRWTALNKRGTTTLTIVWFRLWKRVWLTCWCLTMSAEWKSIFTHCLRLLIRTLVCWLLWPGFTLLLMLALYLVLGTTRVLFLVSMHVHKFWSNVVFITLSIFTLIVVHLL